MNINTEISSYIPVDDMHFQDYHEMIDYVEKCISTNLGTVELPLAHTITPGLYTREMFAPKGTIITSKIHNTDHQFIVSKGVIWILDNDTNCWNRIEAPFRGITKKGSRRVGYVEEDVLWTTIHATPLVEDKEYSKEEFITLLGDIEDSIIDKRDVKLLNT